MTDVATTTPHPLPAGVTLLRTLRGHEGMVGRIAWSPDGKLLASPSGDGTVRLWDVDTGECLRILRGPKESINAVAFSPNENLLASGGARSLNVASFDTSICLWNPTNGKLVRQFGVDSSGFSSFAFDPTGRRLASGSYDTTVKLWEVATGRKIQEIGRPPSQRGPEDDVVYCVAFDGPGRIIKGARNSGLTYLTNAESENPPSLPAHGRCLSVVVDSVRGILGTAGDDEVTKLWEARTGRLLRTLEGHTGPVVCVDMLRNTPLLATRGAGSDGTVRLWRSDSGVCVATIAGHASDYWMPGLAFHPRRPLLANVGSNPGAWNKGAGDDRLIHIYQLDLDLLLGHTPVGNAHYVNAKIVVMGDTGVGKSGLCVVLNGHPYKETDSTAGRHVWPFESSDVEVEPGVTQTRETLLWDLAGQPGYRVIHQLHLNETTVALIVFDSRSETDPLAGVRHWERALRVAQQRQGAGAIPLKKFLVSARNDRGGIAIGEERLQAVLREFGFDGYFKTSAKAGWEIGELREAIRQAIVWERLPEVSSSQLFANIKSFLLNVKKTGRVLAPAASIYEDFVARHADTASNVPNLRDQVETCIGRLENRDLIRRLTFGGYVLLQPELLDAYASAMVNAAREEPDGFGSLAEEIALTGRFFVPAEQRIQDKAQEQLLLHATVEELVRHDLALRENADDGRYLVFPSQFTRDYEDAPEPKGAAVNIAFDGPVQSIYSTLAVRLGHSGLFSTSRVEMWRNAAVFSAAAGGKCGLFLHEFAEGRGRLTLFFDQQTSVQTRFHFEEYVFAHTKRRALDGSVELVRLFVCESCGDPVPDSYVKRLRERGELSFDCPCRGGKVPLTEPKERIQFHSELAAMEQSADRQRNLDAFVMSAKGETRTEPFHEWAGGEHVTLAIVFTDVVGSTSLGEEIKDQAMNEVRRAHFARSRKLIDSFKGREVKTNGDSFMAAFKSAATALDYALAFQKATGHPKVRIRAGIHIGPMRVDENENDVFGGTVNFAAGVTEAIAGPELWLSDRARDDVQRFGATQHQRLTWERHDGVVMKGFTGEFTLWAVKDR